MFWEGAGGKVYWVCFGLVGLYVLVLSLGIIATGMCSVADVVAIGIPFS